MIDCFAMCTLFPHSPPPRSSLSSKVWKINAFLADGFMNSRPKVVDMLYFLSQSEILIFFVSYFLLLSIAIHRSIFPNKISNIYNYICILYICKTYIYVYNFHPSLISISIICRWSQAWMRTTAGSGTSASSCEYLVVPL